MNIKTAKISQHGFISFTLHLRGSMHWLDLISISFSADITIYRYAHMFFKFQIMFCIKIGIDYGMNIHS